MTFDTRTPFPDRIVRIYDGTEATSRLIHYGRFRDAPPFDSGRVTIILADDQQKGGRWYWRTLLGIAAWRLSRRVP